MVTKDPGQDIIRDPGPLLFSFVAIICLGLLFDDSSRRIGVHFQRWLIYLSLKISETFGHLSYPKIKAKSGVGRWGLHLLGREDKVMDTTYVRYF